MHSRSLPPLLFVDGYNIIGLWPQLRRTRDRHGFEPARRDLTEILLNYSTACGWETQLVFDAQYRREPAKQETLAPLFHVRYTDFGQTADTYIEKSCARLGRKADTHPRRFIVATSDRAQQQMAVGYGAEWMSAYRLASEVETVRKRVRHQQTPKRRSRRASIDSALDPATYQQLAKLRMGLS